MVTALLLLDRRAHDEARSRVMGELLSALTTQPGLDEVEIRRRAQQADVALPDPPFAVLVGLDVGEPAVRGRLAAEAARLAVAERGLAWAQPGQVSLVLHAEDASVKAQDVARRLGAAVNRPVAVGAVGELSALASVRAAHSRAFRCAKILRAIGRDGQGATPEQLGVHTLLFSDAGRDQMEDFVREAIGPLLDYDAQRDAALLETLSVYFEVGGQAGRAAEALIVHVNTLYQRLERVDRLLGPGWRRGEQSLHVHLAVRLAGLLPHIV